MLQSIITQCNYLKHFNIHTQPESNIQTHDFAPIKSFELQNALEIPTDWDIRVLGILTSKFTIQ